MSMASESSWVGRKPVKRIGGMSDALSIAADLGFSMSRPPSQVPYSLSVLLKIQYGGAMAGCGGGFTASRHHMTVANWFFCGSSRRPLYPSCDSRTDWERRKSAAACAACRR